MNMIFPSAPVSRTPITAALPSIKVLGLGGGGSNAVNRMIELGIEGVDFITANTDVQALGTSLAPTKIQLGPQLTRGLGSGGKPEIGRAAAEESYRELAEALKGADMVFLTAGLGGGTGTGSIPIAAKIAREQGAVTIAIATMPFSFEMGRRQQNANEGLSALRPYTDTLIAIPNDRLLYIAPKDLPMEVAFRLADDVLRQGVQGIAEIITQPGLINVDFAHIRHLMKLGGGALLSIGQGQGPHKAKQAIHQAMHHPLLDSIALDHAAGVLINFTGGADLTLPEVGDALMYLQEQTGEQAEVIFGINYDNRIHNRAQVILVITGLGATPIEEVIPGIQHRIAPEPLPEIPLPAFDAAPNELPVAAQPVLSVPASQQPMDIPERENPLLYTGMPTNLDLPAFMRRRARQVGQAI